MSLDAVLQAVAESMVLNAVSRATFPKTEIGLLTLEEFLQRQNPDARRHPSDAYDFGLTELNREFSEPVGSNEQHGERRMTVEHLHDGYRVTSEGRPVAVLHDGVMYYDKPHLRHRLPTRVWSRYQKKEIELPVTAFRQVKYLSEVMPLVSPTAKLNAATFPVTLQHITVDGEPMTVRTEDGAVPDKGTTIVVLNKEGLVVAQAADEWGATLITVAREYRGHGLGKIIGKFWYDRNPRYRSGGFTPAGEAAAAARWRDRVRELTAGGFYTQLVREEQLSRDRVRQILSSARPRVPTNNSVSTTDVPVQPTHDILVYSDGVSFIVYDRAFLEDQDERFVHGFGFFRDVERIGTFLYAIDYDRPFADMTTRVALQMARDNGEQLYDGEGYHDLIETDGIPGLVREGDYITVTQDLIPLKHLARRERTLRRAVDPYEDKRHALLEIANDKWR